jgi:hypothetical protein
VSSPNAPKLWLFQWAWGVLENLSAFGTGPKAAPIMESGEAQNKTQLDKL